MRSIGGVWRGVGLEALGLKRQFEGAVLCPAAGDVDAGGAVNAEEAGGRLELHLAVEGQGADEARQCPLHLDSMLFHDPAGNLIELASFN